MLEVAKNYETIVSSTLIDGLDVQLVCVKEGLVKAVDNKKENISHDLESLTPLYVRKSQAEEGR